MKKECLLLLLLLLSFLPSQAQESVTLTFTANTQSGMYCHFDAVNVTNVTRGWTETLEYPDTTLILGYTTGVNVVSEQSLRLGEAYPNPFTGETNVPLEMPGSDFVFLQVVRVDGVVVATSQAHLDAGSHLIKVRISSPSTFLLVVTSSLGGQVARLVCSSSGGSDSITVGPDTRVSNSPNQPENVFTSGGFQPGDMMRYTAVLFDGVKTIYSNTLTQQQNDSQLLTLIFDLTVPQVNTNQVNVLIGHPQIYRSEAVSQSYVNINSYTATGSNSNTDLYHKYDELASAYPLYFRRTEDLATVTDSRTGVSYTIRSYEMNYNNRWLINHEPTNDEVITSDATNYWDEYSVEPRKIILVSGVHGEEHVPTWGLMLALQEILSSDEDWAHFIKDNFVFKIIPCLNPAGWSNCRRGNSVYDATANPPHYHVLNRAESMGDPEAVAYLDFMEANKDAFILIDNHGTQGHYMYLPLNINYPIADMVNFLATKLSSVMFQHWQVFYESIETGMGSTYAPFCVAKSTFSQPTDGAFSKRALDFGLNYMNTETPDNLNQGGNIGINDLRCCKLTKDLVINILQIVCCLPSLGGGRLVIIWLNKL